MAQTQTARGAALRQHVPGSALDTIVPREPDDRSEAVFSSPRPGSPLARALDRLIARIETGTATPEDLDDLPDGVVEYLDALLTLEETGLLPPAWEATPMGRIVVRGVGG